MKAMKGTYAAFTMTNYWEKMDMQLEIDQGKRLADAAKETGVQHYIWSSLLNINKRKSVLLTTRVEHGTDGYHSDQRKASSCIPL